MLYPSNLKTISLATNPLYFYPQIFLNSLFFIPITSPAALINIQTTYEISVLQESSSLYDSYHTALLSAGGIANNSPPIPRTRLFLQFDLSTLTSAIENADLELLMWRNNGFIGSYDFFVYSLTETWDPSTIVWQDQPAYNLSPITTFNGSDLQDQSDYLLSLDITSAVQQWLSNPSSNFGLVILSDTSYGSPLFYKTNSSYGGTGPLLTITTVPLPPALWLFTSGIFSLIGLSRRKQTS